MSETNRVERPVMPVAWAMLRTDGLVLDVICPDEHERYEGEYTLPLYSLAPDQIAALKKYEVEKVWAARDLSKCKCDHNETCEHCLPPNLRHNG